MRYLTNKLIAHRNLLIFILLNYLDKFIVFSLPLLVLYISKDQQIYNNIEYIFSIAGILISFIDLGIGSYLFYGFKETEDKANYIIKIKQYFGLILIIYEIIALILIPLYFIFNGIGILLPFIFIRALYLLFVNFYSSYYRLKDSPSLIFWLSIPANLLSVLLILILKHLSDFTLFCFFAPQLLVLCIGTYYFIVRQQKIKLKELKQFFSKTLIYSWPIIINVSLVAYIGNFGKIYAYNYLNSDEMYQISYTLRISLIIQMAHASIIAFYSKSIYEDKNNKINSEILKKYLFFLFIAVLLFLGFILLLNQLEIVKPIRLNVANFLIVVYTVLWCLRSYVEMYLGKHNKNRIILLFSIISSIFFSGYILIFGINNFLQLSIIMVITAIFSFILTIYYLNKLQLSN